MTKPPPSVVKTIDYRPVLVNLAAADKEFFPGLLESQAGTGDNARYDILFADPVEIMVATTVDQVQQLLELIDCQPAQESQPLPFDHGWLVYLSYEAATQWQPKLTAPDNGQILAMAMRCNGSVVFDRVTDKTHLCGISQRVIDKIEQRLAIGHVDPIRHNQFHFDSVEAADDFQQGIKICQQYIRRGDIYQANLSRRWHYHSTDKNVCAAALFVRLKEANPAPFAALFQYRDWAVVSSSPERLFNVKAGQVSTRPIAGTHPRVRDFKSDQLQIKRLISDDKEQAEHIMLVDLERNDIGQVSQSGTVVVDEFMVVESYPHVHHIVSNVAGRFRTDMMISDVIKALFPGGTITGCPKLRCMQIIAEIEQRPRAAYTGSIGYISHHGQADFNILIRSLSLQGQALQFNAGAGIVYDSDASKETEETEHKAKGLVRALSS
ncbi:MAG: aminodeoxychorismate synthase, component I [Proteobacteria bacterium]|nr:MAG: aminodeoxychorismate synthase, component I [Pseudomonadota bacterium]